MGSSEAWGSPVAHGLIAQVLHQWQRYEHVVDGLGESDEHVPRAAKLGQHFDLFGQLVRIDQHVVNVDLSPQRLG